VAAPVSARRKIQSRIAWSVVAVITAVSAFLGVAYYREVSTEVQTIRTFVPAPDGAEFVLGGSRAGPVEISPNGRHLVFVASKGGQNMLWIRSLDALEARPLTGTNGAYCPFWSPDSRHVGFFAQGKLKKIPLAGGPALTLCDAPDGRGGTWSQDNDIVFAGDFSDSLWRVSAAGGEPTQVTKLDKSRKEETHRFPHFLPDGRHFLYVARSPGGAGEPRRVLIFAGSIDSEERKPILETSGNAAYASGHFMFPRGRMLMAQRFDPDRLEPIGNAFPIAENVHLDNAFNRAGFSVSRNGILAYQTTDTQSDSDLVWYDRSGAQVGIAGDPARYRNHRISPDGTTALVVIEDPEAGNADLWMVDLVRGIRTRFTFEDSDDRVGIWSPDGSRVVFSSNREGSYSIFQKPADGSGEAKFIQEIEGGLLFCSSWSPDGQHLVCGGIDLSGKTSWDIFLLSLSEDAELTSLIQTPFLERWPQVSPNGRWLAYISNESGIEEVYVRPFPLRGGRWQVSSSGGTKPRWGPDGKELFYLDRENMLTVTRLEPGERSLKVGKIEPLFQGSFARIVGWPYDIAPDGQRFLANVSQEREVFSPITVVVNWTADLGK
jgi:Tol biopolymer transport system component